jgi:hypothetical protein
MTQERAALFADTVPRIRTLGGLAEVEALARYWLADEPYRSQILSQIALRRAELSDPKSVPLAPCPRPEALPIDV